MSKRNSIRIGPDPHSAESVAYAVKRYGPIKKKTLAALKKYLDSPEGKAERTYEIYYEMISDMNVEEMGYVFRTEDSVHAVVGAPEHNMLRFPVIKTNRHGSAIMKYIDNEHDAQNTLANIRNKNFPNNKQGQ